VHRTHFTLDDTSNLIMDVDIAVFHEILTFMYAVLEDHLKTAKGKSLFSQ
jgi:hypothetical protein